MLEKVILATTITFLLNLFLGLSMPSSASKTNLQFNWIPEQRERQPTQIANSQSASQQFFEK